MSDIFETRFKAVGFGPSGYGQDCWTFGASFFDDGPQAEQILDWMRGTFGAPSEALGFPRAWSYRLPSFHLSRGWRNLTVMFRDKRDAAIFTLHFNIEPFEQTIER